MDRFSRFAALLVSFAFFAAPAVRGEATAAPATQPEATTAPAGGSESVTPSAPPAAAEAPAQEQGAAPAAKKVLPPAPASAPVQAAEEFKPKTQLDNEPLPSGYGKPEGVLGPVTFGPSVTVIGAPAPFKAALEFKAWNRLGAQLSYGFLPKITFGSASAKLDSYDARLRWFPFAGAFFLGAAYGKLKVTASKTDTILASPVTANVTLENTYIAPHLGWRWTWASGFFMGMDLGWQFSQNPQTTFSSDASALVQAQAEYQKLDSDVRDAGNKLGKQGIPMLTLVELGWLF